MGGVWMSPDVRNHAIAVLALGLLAALLAGCGTEPGQGGDQSRRGSCGTRPKQVLPPPAEPAESPEPDTEPAGRVVPVGRTPEGIVADERTGLVVIALTLPGDLVFVDGDTGQTVRRVPLPGRLRHLQLQNPGGPVLVPVEGADLLLRVTLPQGEVITNVPVGNFPHDATATASGAIAVANEFGGTMSVIENEEVVYTFREATTPSGLDAIGQIVGMADTRENTLSFYDIPARECIAELSAGAGVTHVAAGGGRFFVTDTRGGAILVYDAEPQPEMVGRLDLNGAPYGIAYDSGRDWLWVTLTARNQLVGIDVSGEQLRSVTRIPTIQSPYSVAVNSATGRVFVVSPTEGTLQLIDPAQAGQPQG